MDVPKKPAKKVAAKSPAKAPAKSATKPPKKSAKKRPVSPLDATIAKYSDHGWTIIVAPKGGLNDLIASKGERLHHIQVVTVDTIDEPQHHGEPKNNFIQNAFSNNAVPVFAHVVKSMKKDDDGTKFEHFKVTFEDVNTRNRVIIGGKKAAAAPKPAATKK